MSTESPPRRVRAWYGLPGEIVIEGDSWHLVKMGPVPLPHPPLVNRLIRRGLPQEARLRLSYWHELGHLQTLPIALAHAAWQWRRRPDLARESSVSRALRFAVVLIAHEAAWELAAESYGAVRTGPEYRRLYRERRNPFLAAFWVGMAGLTLVGTTISLWRESSRR